MASSGSTAPVSWVRMFLVCVCGVVLGGLISCKDAGSEPPVVIPSTLALSVDDVSCTEAWLKLSTSAGPCSVLVRRDGLNIGRLYLNTRDSTLSDDSLLPKRTYFYQAFKTYPVSPADSTQKVQATTMDTTSHAITWQTFALGDPASSILYDVAIINDSLVYAGGEIYLRDSTGQVDPYAYCLAIWNGTSWRLKRLYYDQNDLIVSIRGIFVSSPSEIWLGAGSIFRWDGASTQTQLVFDRLTLPDPSATVEKVSGSGSNLYGVGNAGTIVCYRGMSWQKLASGTSLNFRDIWGATNPKTGKQEILAVASDPFGTHDKTIVQISGTTVTTISDSGVAEAISTVWFSPGREYYVAGSGITSALYRKHLLSDPRWTNDVVPAFHYYVFSIRGNEMNDMFTCGGFGEVVHFNGMSYKNYSASTAVNGIYFSIAVKGNLVVAVGDGQGGTIAIGKR